MQRLLSHRNSELQKLILDLSNQSKIAHEIAKKPRMSSRDIGLSLKISNKRWKLE